MLPGGEGYLPSILLKMKYPLPAATNGHRTETCIIQLAGGHKIPVAQIIPGGYILKRTKTGRYQMVLQDFHKIQSG